MSNNATPNISSLSLTSGTQSRCCWYCGRGEDALTTKLQRCTRCRLAVYCNRECQRGDWKLHKAKCYPKKTLQAQNSHIITSGKSDITTPPIEGISLRTRRNIGEILAMRSQIPYLNEDVQGYIASFLSGFDDLRTAAHLGRGFRSIAKPRLDAMLKRSDDDIKVAARAWCENAEEARKIYGHISIWNTSCVTDMSSVFCADTDLNGCGEAAKQFNDDISRWDVSNVEDMQCMFFGASAFNGDLSSWNVSKVTCMECIFSLASAFNGDISSWDVRNVKNMNELFYDAVAFNGDLSSWNVSNVTNMGLMFEGASAFNGDLSSWDVSNVQQMQCMFKRASAFNGDISSWNVSNVKYIGSMFEEASAFSGDISSWNVENCGSMEDMFKGALAFDIDTLASWGERGEFLAWQKIMENLEMMKIWR